MSELKKTFSKNTSDEESDDNSEHNLQIVESPSPKWKSKPIEPTKTEKMIIESIEDELERRLEEKAAKTKLNSTHVKNIIKHVVTNEHVLALVRKTEFPMEYDESVPYEPKLTRAKAKELLSNTPAPPVPWGNSKPISEVQALFSEELEEDSSGDEYVPGEEEEDDDQDGSVISDPPSVPPPTPSTPTPNADSYTQTNWTEDKVFKIPPAQHKDDNEEEANIALRTRSKLSLSSTPLEVIEEAFIPPDITTDMYDMDCDNDDWMDFLKKFTRPFDEIAKGTEDEEQDPEYNILADEEIDMIDIEELRMDKAVKVSRKELTDLVAELFDYAENCMADEGQEVETELNSATTRNEENTANTTNLDRAEIDRSQGNLESVTVVVNNASNIVTEDISEDIMIKAVQLPLLEQQMRQHVQMLTQNFLLTYNHPELHHQSLQLKEYLLNFKHLCAGKSRSMFYTVNLFPALQLTEDWQTLWATDSEEVKKMDMHIKKTLAESLQRKKSALPYVVTFPELMLRTISNSNVFLYPLLLPKIPFKSPQCFSDKVATYTNSEDYLIAVGLEQFEELLRQDKRNMRGNKVQINLVCNYIQKYMMPHKHAQKLLVHVERYKHGRCGSNPIKYYFENRKAPRFVHYVIPLDQLKILPPCQRSPEELPYQWKMFLYPTLCTPFFPDTISQGYTTPIDVQTQTPILPKPTVIVDSTSNYFSFGAPNRIKKKKKEGCTKPKHKNKSDPISKFIECLGRPSQIRKLIGLYTGDRDQRTNAKGNRKLRQYNPTHYTMLPSMPNLNTPVKKKQRNGEQPSSNLKNSDKNINAGASVSIGESRKGSFEFSTISSTSFQQPDRTTEVEFCNPANSARTITSNSQNNALSECTFSKNGEAEARSSIRDNLGDINTLLVASPTVKPAAKKEPSGAEKKRAKLRREFLANLSVSTPEDLEAEKQKNEMFALAYYDKMRETLELEDYHKIMQILNDHEEGDAVDLYKKVKEVLSPKYQELADEFLLFLREKEAAAAGQLIPWIRMSNRSKFLRKLEIYFKDQPAQLRKIYKCLTELSQTVGVSMEKIKNTLLPMFKGNAVLSDLFLQNFLDERPPLSLLEGPYETIDINKEMSKTEDEIYETITVPNIEDKYGGPSCICNCHQIEDPEFKSRYRHCIRCGTRFINGKVYIQTGRGLRPAAVSFLTSPNVDHNIRLLGKTPTTTSQRKKRSETSPSKRVTFLTTENGDEETEDEIDGKKKTKKKPPRKKKSPEKSPTESRGLQKSTSRKKTVSERSDGTKFRSTSPTQKSGSRKRTNSARRTKSKDKSPGTQEVEHLISKPGANLNQQKRLAEESLEWGENVTTREEPFIEMKPNSPDQQTAESESEFCEESSQDNCESDSNSSVSSSNNHSQSDSNLGDESSWKREEDKIILETFQKENDKEHAFKTIADQLKNRTVPQISNRFQTLMTLLLETLGTS